MSRKPRTASDVHRRLDEERLGHPARGRFRSNRQGLDFMEVLAAVCNELASGCTAAEIRRRMEQRGILMTREEPYEFISYAARHGWLEFHPPSELKLTQELRQRAPFLNEVEVVHTSSFDDVAARGADVLVRLVQRRVREQAKYREAVHIGFAGGHAMRKLAREFAQRLRTPLPDMPQKLVFHAMVAGFNVLEPGTNPNAFFVYFEDDPAMHVETSFVCLLAPPMVTAEALKELEEQEAISDTFVLARDLDIIVTSAGEWSDEHNTLRQYMTLSRAEDDIAALDARNTVADMLWQPLGNTGPVEVETGTRALTLLKLREIPQRIREGVRVLMCLGPCLKCHRSKEAALRALLGQTEPIITDLVTDSVTARRYLYPLEHRPAAVMPDQTAAAPATVASSILTRPAAALGAAGAPDRAHGATSADAPPPQASGAQPAPGETVSPKKKPRQALPRRSRKGGGR